MEPPGGVADAESGLNLRLGGVQGYEMYSTERGQRVPRESKTETRLTIIRGSDEINNRAQR